MAVSSREDDCTIDGDRHHVEEFMKYVSTQIEDSELESVSKLRKFFVEPEKKVNDQCTRLSQQLFRLSLIKDDDAKVAFYTGFSSYPCHKTFFDFLGQAANSLIYSKKQKEITCKEGQRVNIAVHGHYRLLKKCF